MKLGAIWSYHSSAIITTNLEISQNDQQPLIGFHSVQKSLILPTHANGCNELRDFDQSFCVELTNVISINVQWLPICPHICTCLESRISPLLTKTAWNVNNNYNEITILRCYYLITSPYQPVDTVLTERAYIIMYITYEQGAFPLSTKTQKETDGSVWYIVQLILFSRELEYS